METKDIILAVFRKNRIGVREIEENVRFSYIEHVLERIISKEILTDSRTKRIRDELALRLGYTPDIREDWCTKYIMVYTKNPSPYSLSYPKAMLKTFEYEYYYLPFFPGVEGNGIPLVFDFNNSPLVLINGLDGYGKTNLIKVIIESSCHRGNVEYIIGDLSDGGYRNGDCINVIREKDGVLVAIEKLNEEIKHRREYCKKKENTKEKENFKDIVFIIDDYSSLCTTHEDAEALFKKVNSIKKSGRKYGIFLVLSAPRIPDFFGNDFVSLFSLIFTFRMKDEGESYLLHNLDDLPLPLYESGDAFCLDNKEKTITRMQCFQL